MTQRGATEPQTASAWLAGAQRAVSELEMPIAFSKLDFPEGGNNVPGEYWGSAK